LSRFAVIKERYLRDDIACGSAYCSACGALEHQKRVLHAAGFGGSDLLKEGHYVVPDTNAFLHQVRSSRRLLQKSDVS
jgi:exosome complex exonuclease DIS3/RRP44